MARKPARRGGEAPQQNGNMVIRCMIMVLQLVFVWLVQNRLHKLVYDAINLALVCAVHFAVPWRAGFYDGEENGKVNASGGSKGQVWF